MSTDRRDFIKWAGVAAFGSVALSRCQAPTSEVSQEPFAGLTSMTGDIQPIQKLDFANRHNRARSIMRREGIDSLFLSGSTNLYYFSGINMGGGDRLFATLLPREGAPAIICPAFELGRAKESIKYGEEDIRMWEEDEDPFKLAGEILREKGIDRGLIGVDEDLPYWYYYRLAQAVPQAKYRNADVVTNELRMVKEPKEIALIRRAVEVTIEGYKAAFKTIHPKISEGELSQNISLAIGKLGASGGGWVSFEPASSSPHGTIATYSLREGSVILVDGGCRLDNYSSDITRTITFGEPSEKVKDVWETVRKAQKAAIEVIRPGVACQELDRAARRVVEESGYGPGYKFFTHRLGHGLGLKGHEPPYMVEGNTLPLKKGMVFTVEPGIYIPGEFGVRLEDNVVVTEEGCEVLGNSMATAIDKPFG